MPEGRNTMPEPSRLRELLNRPIALVGMMGSGKSLVGRRLARVLDLPFVDSDSRVEAAAGISVAEIFEIAGEAKFREMERTAIEAEFTSGPIILSTGGGAICAESTARLLCENSIVVWLYAEPETLISRIGSVGSRPLLHSDDPLQTLRRLAESRAGDYGKAHITVKTDELSAPAATNAVLRALDRHLTVT
jgi:shikimate kinase